MKLAALYCLYGSSPWLPYSFKAIYDCVDAIYLFVSELPWYGTVRDTSKLEATLSSLSDPKGKAVVIRGRWGSETEQRNVSLATAQLDGFSHGLIIDGDEVYDHAAFLLARSHVEQRPEVGCFHVKWFTYWKSPRYRIDPIEPYDPPILVRLGAGGFAETRNVVAPPHELIPPQLLMCHHLSYALSDEEIKEKHIAQPGHSQSMQTGWFDKVWRAWDSNHALENLHPVNPPWYRRAVLQPREALPSILHHAYDTSL